MLLLRATITASATAPRGSRAESDGRQRDKIKQTALLHCTNEGQDVEMSGAKLTAALQRNANHNGNGDDDDGGDSE